MSKKRVVFEKYNDIFNRNLYETNAEINEKDIVSVSTEQLPYLEQENKIFAINPTKVISTPFGLLSMTDASNASTQFDFWVMHTNFDITEDVANRVSAIEGVESIEIMTRYRARIGFPKSETLDNKGNRIPMFDIAQIMANIKKEITCNKIKDNLLKDIEIKNKFDNRTLKRVIKLRNRIYPQNDFWLIYIFPNASLMGKKTDEENKYKKFVKQADKLYSMIGGMYITYQDY